MLLANGRTADHYAAQYQTSQQTWHEKKIGCCLAAECQQQSANSRVPTAECLVRSACSTTIIMICFGCHQLTSHAPFELSNHTPGIPRIRQGPSRLDAAAVFWYTRPDHTNWRLPPLSQTYSFIKRSDFQCLLISLLKDGTADICRDN